MTFSFSPTFQNKLSKSKRSVQTLIVCYVQTSFFMFIFEDCSLYPTYTSLFLTSATNPEEPKNDPFYLFQALIPYSVHL